MKIIVSHDVDHVYAWEHYNDMIIPKLVVRSTVEYLLRRISFSSYCSRFYELIGNKWQYIDELMKYDKSNGVPSTFFVAVKNGRCLKYRIEDAIYWMERIKENMFDIGLHAIAYDNEPKIVDEYKLFRDKSKKKSFGVRVHYLKMKSYTLEIFEKTGFAYDSTKFVLTEDYQVGKMKEYPLHIMDSDLFYGNNWFQKVKLNKAMRMSKDMIERAYNSKIKCFTILFHDRYFSDAYSDIREWYMWIIGYLKSNGFEFTSYDNELIKSSNNR